METVRRNKLCLHLRTRKPTKRLTTKNKTFATNQVGNVATCSNHPDVCHPYDDNINFTHVLNDVQLAAKHLYAFINSDMFYTYQYRIPYDQRYFLDRKCYLVYFALSKLVTEVYYADKNRSLYTVDDPSKTFFSQLEGNQNRNVPECGNYINHAHHLVETAKRSVVCSKSRSEKRIHLKKLKLFQALSKVQETKLRY